MSNGIVGDGEFGEALRLLKIGYRLTRNDWNENMYLVYQKRIP
jgi:hypothetical protein